jgi:hypothetical protein
LRKASLGFDNLDELQQWLENSESSDTSSNWKLNIEIK